MNTHSRNVLLAEIAEEKAATLGRAGAEMEAALQALKTFELPAGLPAHAHAEQRRPLLARAVRATLSYVVQREACGLRDAVYVFEHYGVPREVVVRLGGHT